MTSLIMTIQVLGKQRYENLAEKNVLKQIFLKKAGYWFLDIGGSYGSLPLHTMKATTNQSY